MKKIKKLIIGALILSISVATSGCTIFKRSVKVSPDTVLGEVNGKEITLESVDLELVSYINYLKEEYGEDFENSIDEQTRLYLNSQRATTLNQLIQEQILLKKADELNLIPSDDELSKKIEEQISELEEFYGSKEKLEEAKKEFNYTDETFNEFIKSQIIQEIVVEDITKDISVSNEEIKTYYEDNKDTYFTQNPGANTQHILFETEEEAKKCLEEINNKQTTFDEKFNEYTDNKNENKLPISENLGFVEYDNDNFDADFLEGLKNIKENEISEPIKTSFGYHLIKVSEIQTEKTIVPFNNVKDSIKEQLLYDKKYELYQNKLIEWKEEMNVKITASSIGYEPENE